MQEVWRPVVGYEGLYEVSDQGRVRSLDRWERNGRGMPLRLFKGKVLKSTPGSSGYLRVCLSKSGGLRHFTVHTLVLNAFVGPRPEGLQCRHLNGIQTDARLCNLAWGTIKENTNDRISHGKQPRGEAHPCAKLTIEDVLRIRSSTLVAKELAQQLGVSKELIKAIRNRRCWRWV